MVLIFYLELKDQCDVSNAEKEQTIDHISGLELRIRSLRQLRTESQRRISQIDACCIIIITEAFNKNQPFIISPYTYYNTTMKFYTPNIVMVITFDPNQI